MQGLSGQLITSRTTQHQRATMQELIKRATDRARADIKRRGLNTDTPISIYHNGRLIAGTGQPRDYTVTTDGQTLTAYVPI